MLFAEKTEKVRFTAQLAVLATTCYPSVLQENQINCIQFFQAEVFLDLCEFRVIL